MSSVMDRIRRAAAAASSGPLADARLRPAFPRVAARSPFPPDADLADHIARFRAELEALGGAVYGPLGPDAAAGQVVELVRTLCAGPGDGEAERNKDGQDGQDREVEGEVALTPTLSRGERGSLPPGEGAIQNPALRTQHSAPSAPPSALRTSHSALHLLAWSPAELGCPGLEERLAEAGVDLVGGDVPNDEGYQRTLERLASLGVGLTGAIAGLADTGSIVVASGPGRSRVASLLPPVHIALLPVARLHPTMQEWLAAGGAALVANTANLVVVTGSSRTSDIELQLTLGMHGPRELHVVMVTEKSEVRYQRSDSDL